MATAVPYRISEEWSRLGSADVGAFRLFTYVDDVTVTPLPDSVGSHQEYCRRSTETVGARNPRTAGRGEPALAPTSVHGDSIIDPVSRLEG